MEKTGVVIIGAGVVGLSIAAELSKKNQEIILLEKETSFGQSTSSRNSEVIHAGIYYPKDSLKARLCVEGNRLLYEYCQKQNIAHKRLGKIIVAENEAEVKELEELRQKGQENGVRDLAWMAAKELAEYEPAVKAVKALSSPNTGIIDSHQLMKALEAEAKSNGVILAYGNAVTGLKQEPDGYLVQLAGGEPLKSDVVINSAGLAADQIAAMVGIDIDQNKYRLKYCKGEYFAYTRPSVIKHLVYPVPGKDAAGLGVHSVIDLAGGLKFGPSAEYVSEIEYRVDPTHRKVFWESIKELFPQIKEADLAPDQAGVRPKLQGPGEAFRDFVIKEEASLGYPGLINLIGIESPGLTACLAIARYVGSLI
ncbi:MAG: NAD(P)/FAD-dependent oxidoreductase [Candidatus Margulisiibacteriota bacterium]